MALSWALYMLYLRKKMPDSEKVTSFYLFSLAWQLVHFVEENSTGFRYRWPVEIFGAEPYGDRQYVAINALSYAIFIAGAVALLKRRPEFSMPAIFFSVMGVMFQWHPASNLLNHREGLFPWPVHGASRFSSRSYPVETLVLERPILRLCEVPPGSSLVSALGESCAAARWCYFCHARCIIIAMPRKQSPRWNRRPEERPGELAEAALKLFCKQGYFVTSIEDIARFAGATKGAVYHHYDSKEKLFEAAIVRYFERSFERAAADMEQHPDSDVLARIEALLRAGGEVWCSDEFPSIVCLVLGEAGQNIPQVRKTFMKMGPIRGRKAVADLIKRGQIAGVVRNDMDPLAAARIVNSGLAFGMTLVTSSGASHAGRQRQFEASLRAVLTMLSFPSRQ